MIALKKCNYNIKVCLAHCHRTLSWAGTSKLKSSYKNIQCAANHKHIFFSLIMTNFRLLSGKIVGLHFFFFLKSSMENFKLEVHTNVYNSGLRITIQHRLYNLLIDFKSPMVTLC